MAVRKKWPSIIGVEPSLDNLPDPKAFSISPKEMIAKDKPKQVFTYLRQKGYPIEELEKIIEQKKRVRYKGRYWSTSQRGIVDIVFHKSGVRTEMSMEEIQEKIDLQKEQEIIDKTIKRTGRAFMEVKELIRPFFDKIKTKHKTLDDFCLYSTETEINNELQNHKDVKKYN